MPIFQIENKKGDQSEQSDSRKVSAFKYALFRSTQRFYAWCIMFEWIQVSGE